MIGTDAKWFAAQLIEQGYAFTFHAATKEFIVQDPVHSDGKIVTFVSFTIDSFDKAQKFLDLRS